MVQVRDWMKSMRSGMMRMGLTAGLALCLGAVTGCEMTSHGDQASPDSEPAPEPAMYAVGGRAGGVPKRVVLRLEFEGGSELLAVTRDGSFWFDTLLPQGARYNVVLVDAPPCLLDRATGTLADANVEMALSCQGAAALSELAVSGAATPALAFSPGQIAYTIDVPVLQQRIVLSPVAMRDEDIITVAGQPVTSGTPSAPLALGLGDNHIEVAVYYPRGELSLTRTYHLNVRRAAAVAQYAHGEAATPT